jgi:hypothetical protein
MAKPVDLGLVLEGEDAVRFIKHMENPMYTEDVIELAKMAIASVERKQQSVIN